MDAHVTELAVLVTGFAVCLYFTFLLPHPNYSPIVLYAPVPFLIWAATRLGPIGISTANSALALVSMISAAEGKGPFSTNYSHHSVLSMQLFLAVISAPTLAVAILIRERREVENSLRESQENLKQLHEHRQLLAHKLINSQEEERRRIARDLHDHVGQSLALLAVALDQASQDLPAQMGVERSVIGNLHERVVEIGRDIHELSHQLHSSTLQQLGLEVALKVLCQETARQHHIVVNFQSTDADGIPQEVSLCAFRVAQEALNNAVRHGRAQHIGVTVQKEGNLLRVLISDTGVGFDPARSSEGLGLISMQERLRMLGGQLVVKSQPGKGTYIGAEMPVKEAA
jgi:signal transduction histidine kinase